MLASRLGQPEPTRLALWARSLSRLLRRLAFVPALLALAHAPASRAERDAFSLGDGHHGARVVAAPNTLVNAWAPLVEGADAGALTVRVASTAGFAPGDLVMLLQHGLEGPAPDSGSQEPFDVASTGLGRFELARVAGMSAGELALTAPLVQGFPQLLSQALTVPEYSELTVLDGGSVVARAWDGASGGVVAMLVSGPLRNEGLISAQGRGYRGGAWALGHDGYNCARLDEPHPGGAGKGEGPALGAYGSASTGYGNVLSGAGGGNCNSGAGAGGGHGGAGGAGGAWSAGGGKGGLGGVPLRYAAVERLVMGGGGGSGHCGDNRSPAGGGAGGGVVFIRAAAVLGTGRISVAGAGGRLCEDGAGGGAGAGGLLSLRARGPVGCALLSAAGGLGADGYGGGGGGSGGRIVGQAADFSTCPTDVSAGLSGRGGVGATPTGPFSPGHFGDVTVVAGAFDALAAPSIESPRGGATVGATPAVSGTAPAEATVTLLVDGRPWATAASDSDGGFALEVSAPLSLGERRLEAAASRSGIWSQRSAPVLVTVTAGAGVGVGAGQRVLTVGCGCVASSGRSAPGLALFAALLLLSLARLARRRAPLGPDASCVRLAARE